MDKLFFIRQVKANILSGKYGKFDFIEKLIENDILMLEKPRVILQVLSGVLEMPIDKINYQTFNSWLRRYRKKNVLSPENDKRLSAYGLKNGSDIKILQVNTSGNANDDWRNIQPSEPEPQQRSTIRLEPV